MRMRGVLTRQALILLLALVVIALFVPVFGPHSWGYWGWSPLGLLVIVLVVLLIV